MAAFIAVSVVMIAAAAGPMALLDFGGLAQLRDANTAASRSASLRRRVRAAAAQVHGADTTGIGRRDW